jgi:uncharacterized protein (DUF427 family)
VWSYPRPPTCESSNRHVSVSTPNGELIANSRRAWRVLETSHPPTWYVPPSDLVTNSLIKSASPGTVCEFKGVATYWSVKTEQGLLVDIAWSYETPTPGFAAIAGCLAFSPARLACAVDGERVRPQDGGFYGGWITDDVTGPFKGAPGTLGW